MPRCQNLQSYNDAKLELRVQFYSTNQASMKNTSRYTTKLLTHLRDNK
uniref:Uncharacterized protein n=1 Tax=Arundo donax TaxID=35708 RepID=A0A0A9BLJ0_ARUDO